MWSNVQQFYNNNNNNNESDGGFFFLNLLHLKILSRFEPSTKRKKK